ARMRDLIEQHIAEATTQRTVPTIAEALETEAPRAKTRVAAADPSARAPSAEPAAKPSAQPAPAPAAAAARAGSAEPLQPIPVKTITVRPRAIQNSAFGALVAPAPQANLAPAQWAAAASAPPPSTVPASQAPALSEAA